MRIWWQNLTLKTPCKTSPRTRRTSRAVNSAARSSRSPATSRRTWGSTREKNRSPAHSAPSDSAIAVTGRNTREFISGNITRRLCINSIVYDILVQSLNDSVIEVIGGNMREFITGITLICMLSINN